MSSELWNALSTKLPSARERRVAMGVSLAAQPFAIPGESLMEGLKAPILLAPFPGDATGKKPAAFVDPYEGYHLAGGVRIDRWVKTNPSFERTLWSLLVGEAPTQDQEQALKNDLVFRRTRFVESEAYDDVLKLLETFFANPAVRKQVDIMNALKLVIERLGIGSEMSRIIRGEAGEYLGLQARLEDILNLITHVGVFVPIIATYLKGDGIVSQNAMLAAPSFSAAFAAGLSGEQEPSVRSAQEEVLNAFFAMMSYHGMGNVSTFTSLIPDSAGAALYDSYSALLSGLVAPNHGGASIQALRWILELEKRVGTDASADTLAAVARERLSSKRPIWAVGHGLLRVRENAAPEDRGDPRTRAALGIGDRLCAVNPRYRLAKAWYEAAIPEILAKKAINFPEVNVDGYTGVILGAVGLSPLEEVRLPGGIFAVSRAMGMSAALFWNTAWNPKGVAPIIRPGEYLPEGS